MLTVETAKRILCYGDSNTWGQHPSTRTRFSVNERWTALLQRALGDAVDIIEEGLSSRTTDLDYATKPGRNGKRYLVPCLQSQNPLHAVILMLGTNDLKIEFDRSAGEIATAIKGLVADIRAAAKDGPAGQPPRVLLVSPVPLNPDAPDYKQLYPQYYNERSAAVSRELTAAIKQVASEMNCAFFDAGSVAVTGDDGVHLSQESHAALAAALTPVVKETL